jgi:hypothetical protein
MNRRCRDAGSSVVEHALLTATIAAIVIAGGTLVARSVAVAAEAPARGYTVPATLAPTSPPPSQSP